MKRIIIIALILNFIFPLTVCCEENFKIPEYTIEIPAVFQNLEDNIEESWLDIEWNTWHANARNPLLKFINDLKFKDFYLGFTFYVNKNRQITDIVVYFLPGNSFNKWFAYMKKDGVYYAYVYSTNEFYKFKTDKKIPVNNGFFIYKQDIIEKMTITKTKKEYVPECDKIISFAKDINSLSGIDYLKYPKGSKRYKVRVEGGWQDLIHSGKKYYSSSDFDDTERIKN